MPQYGKFGIQPNGMVRLDNGTLWNPNDPLPPENVGAFNSTPLGSPLNGLGTMAPRAQVAPAASLAAPLAPTPVPTPPSTPLLATSGLGAQPSGASMPALAAGLMQPAGGMTPPMPMPSAPVTAPRGMFGASPVPKPSFLAPGGTGRTIAGIVGDALLAANNRPMVYAPAHERQMEFAKSAYQQQQELIRQLALQQDKRDHPAPSELQRKHDYLVSIGRPDLADTLLRAEANPMTLMTDPTNGEVRFAPKGGIAAPAKPAPAVGTVEQGYKFLGGDPASPSSWQQVH